MILWATLSCILVLIAVAITIPLVRRYEVSSDRSGVATLAAQLADIDAQEQAGSLDISAASQMRLEVKRRILAENSMESTPSHPFPLASRKVLAFGVAVTVTLGTAGIYLWLNPAPQADVQATAQTAAIAPAPEHPLGDVNAMVRDLEARMEAEPGDAEGWRMLGWSYFQMKRFADAAAAYGRAARIDPRDPTFVSAMGEALVQAADGHITDDAKIAFETARRLDSSDARARYFLAALKEQNGDAKGAIDDWLALLSVSPPDAPWVQQLRDVIQDSAARANIDVASRLATGHPQTPAPAAPGPTAADITAAEQMSPEDRQAMIAGMVESLAQKLEDNPNDAEGWVRLMRARMVMGNAAGAADAYGKARRTFAPGTPGRRTIDAAATSLSIQTP